jgi:chromosome partitioning protein
VLKVAVFNMKGGSVKTTSTLSLGAVLARSHSVGLIDLDGQRTLSFGIGMDGAEPTALDWLTEGAKGLPLETQVKGLYLVPGDIGMFRLSADKDLMEPALKGLKVLDLYLMDCPPSLSVASVQAIMAADRVLVPTLCEPAALKGLAEAIELIKGETPDKPIDVLRGQYDSRLVLTREADEMLIDASEDMGFRLLHTTIPKNIALAECIGHQQPISVYAPKSTGALAYKSLAKEISKIWGLR